MQGRSDEKSIHVTDSKISLPNWLSHGPYSDIIAAVGGHVWLTCVPFDLDATLLPEGNTRAAI